MMKNVTDFKKIALNVSKKYLNVPGLQGIIWIGSTAYGISDALADIDIKLVCDKEDSEFKMSQFKSEEVKIEVDTVSSCQLLQKTDPDTDEFWIREKAHILYDPQKILKKKFLELNKYHKKIYQRILIRLYKELFQSYNFEKTMKRRDLITSWMFMFKTLDALSKFCFIYYDKPVPTFKWRWYFIRREKLIESSFIRELESFDSRNFQQTFSLLIKIEQKAQQMMSSKGYSEEFVKEPWLFNISDTSLITP